MKNWILKRRVDSLSDKLAVPEAEKIARFDIRSFTEEEQLLFNKIRGLQEKCGADLPAEVCKANRDLIFKALEILARYAADTFKFVMLGVLGGGNEIEKWYVNLHFQNFLYDLAECVERVQNWPKKEREEHLAFLKETGLIDKAFRIPRGPDTVDLKKKKRK